MPMDYYGDEIHVGDRVELWNWFGTSVIGEYTVDNIRNGDVKLRGYRDWISCGAYGEMSTQCNSLVIIGKGGRGSSSQSAYKSPRRGNRSRKSRGHCGAQGCRGGSKNRKSTRRRR